MKRMIIIAIITIFIIIFLNYLNDTSSIELSILDKDNNEIAYITNNNISNTVNIEDINDEYINYILYIEDRDFYKHNGFSLSRIIKSIYYNFTHNTSHGASTITQQYIKNQYLSNNKNILRKIKEIYLSIRLENKLNKEEILSKYLSTLYFGHNVYGINNAARYYFNKEINKLDKQQIISLIALWNAPSIYSNNYEKWNTKKNEIALKLYKANLINYSDYLDIIKDLTFSFNKEYINSNRLFFIDQVLLEYKKYNIKCDFNTLITLKTYYNKKTESLNSKLDINYALISINKYGYVTSCIGDKSYYNSQYNIAINANRDIGSTIKPLLYYEAIKCNMENMIYNSSPFSFKYNNELITISNSSNKYYGDINLKRAIAVSDNIYAIKTHLALGFKTLQRHLLKYNIACNSYPSLALGSIGMPLIKLSSIYYQFFQDGKYLNKPLFIEAIEYKNKIYKYNPVFNYVNDIDICKKIKEYLKYPFDTSIKNSTCSSISKYLKNKCYGKSGSTDYDSYIIGFDEDNLVACWSGDINNKELTDIKYKMLPKELFYKAMNILS